MMREENGHIPPLQPRDVALMKQVATEAADSSVKSFARLMGMNPDDPLNSQTIFSKLRDPETPSDLDWARRTRKKYERFGAAVLVAIAAGFASALYGAWAVAASYLKAGAN